MILAVPLPPTPGDVVVGVLALLLGALVISVAAFLAVHSGNWLHAITAVGGVLFVAGLVGQRTAADGAALGAWNAGIGVPGLGVRTDLVAAVGIVLGLIGVTLTLVFEQVPQPDDRRRPLVHRALEDDDSI